MRRVVPLVVLLAALVSLAIPRQEAPSVEAETTAPARDAYGVEAGLFSVSHSTVRRNQTLSDLLTPFNVASETIAQIASIARPLFDVRSIREGRPLVVYHDDDSLRTARLVVYPRDEVSYVVFDLRDTLEVRVGEKPVRTATRTVNGTIDGSLYQSFVDQGVDPNVAIRLSEVYAWQIDFFRLQKGDRYTVSFEERYVDVERVGTGRVLASHFEHAGRTFKAYLFDNGEAQEYFDEEGNSLRKAFLAAPVEYSRISSRFSMKRFHPVQKRYKAHLGTDYAAPTGTPIQATGDGVIAEASYTSGNGRYVKVKHNGTYTTQYLHMSRIADGIRPGVSVRQGEVIGFVGSTGLATGPHVCYRFWKNGAQVDPLREEFPSVGPVPDSSRQAFTELKDLWTLHLDLPYGPIGPALAGLN